MCDAAMPDTRPLCVHSFMAGRDACCDLLTSGAGHLALDLTLSSCCRFVHALLMSAEFLGVYGEQTEIE